MTDDLNELKQKLSEAGHIAKNLIHSKVGGSSSGRHRSVSNRRFRMHKRWLVLLLVVLLPAGLLVGFGLSRGGGADASLIRTFFGRIIPVPGHMNDDTFMLSDFESMMAFKPWEIQAAQMELSDEHAAEGSHSGKVTFDGRAKLASISIEDYFTSRYGLHDWSDYEVFRFYIFNQEPQSERILVQIKDRQGNRLKKEFFIPAQDGQHFEILTSEMKKTMDIKQVDQVSFFRWTEPNTATFYFDDVHLAPSGIRVKKPLQTGIEYGLIKERPVNPLNYGFERRKAAWIYKDPQTAGEIVRVPFVVKNELPVLCALCPVEGGIPLPLAELKNLENLRLRNALGEDLPFHARPLSNWPDGSVRWLGLTFKATLQPGEGAGFFLDYGPSIQKIDFHGEMRLEEYPESILIRNKTFHVLLNKKRFFLFDKVRRDSNNDSIIDDNETILSEVPLTLRFRGREYRADLDAGTYTLKIEEAGSQRIVIRAQGWFHASKKERFCQVIVRYYFYEGKDEVKIEHTLIYTGYPQNNLFGDYQDKKLPDNEMVESFSVRMPFQRVPGENLRLQMGRGDGTALESINPKGFRALQKEWEQATAETDQAKLALPDGLAGWLDLSAPRYGLTVALKDLRENFPKAFSYDGQTGEVTLDLWPEAAGPLNLATTKSSLNVGAAARGSAFGLAKTHEILFVFHNGMETQLVASQRALQFKERLVIRNNPFWVDASGAMGRLFPVDRRYRAEEEILSRLFSWAERHPRHFQWYGMLNFGDTLTWWRNEDDSNWFQEFGWHPVGRWGWYNCEGVGTHTGALIQFLRSGEWRYFEFAENLTRHIMDIDTIHYNTAAEDPRLKDVIGDDLSRVGSMHRHNADHWGGRSDEASHTSVWGILLYYYITGSERALEVAKEVGDFFLSEPFTYMGHPDIAPNRALANTLWGTVLLYQATGDLRYKREADKIATLLINGQQPDGSFLENYNPLDKTWSGDKHELFMSGYILGALMAYHELTQDAEIAEVLLRLVRYLAEREYGGPVTMNGQAYAYLITGDPAFLAFADQNLNRIRQNIQTSENPLMDGLIYKKPIYHRPMAFLSTVPYVFGALEEGFARQRKR